jgi:N-acetylglutamate synthase-like GNAT family acetyltransferase
MEFRKAYESDIERIMDIISQAQAYFKAQGINQWQNNYPNPEIVRKDIEGENGYILMKDNSVVATVAVSFDGEKTYKTIYDGKWITDGEYAVIHRLAVDNRYKGSGLSSVILGNIEKMCLGRGIRSIKVDTHKENKSMQKMLSKNGFKYCGIIFLEDKSPRIAFEKTL